MSATMAWRQTPVRAIALSISSIPVAAPAPGPRPPPPADDGRLTRARENAESMSDAAQTPVRAIALSIRSVPVAAPAPGHDPRRQLMTASWRARENAESMSDAPSCAARAPPLHRAVPIPHRRRRPRSTRPSTPAPRPGRRRIRRHPLQGIKTAISPAGKSSLKIEREHTP
jgi:hypothetical protein